jgi:hypothetical protein
MGKLLFEVYATPYYGIALLDGSNATKSDFLVAGNLESKLERVHALVQENADKAFYPSVIKGAASTSALIVAFGTAMALAPCPMCKMGLWAALGTAQGIAGVGTILSTANVISRYVRWQEFKTLDKMMKDSHERFLTNALEEDVYAPFEQVVKNRELKDKMEQYSKHSQTLKDCCDKCATRTKKQLKGLSAELGSIYDELAYVTQQERFGYLPKEALRIMNKTYGFCAKEFKRKLFNLQPRHTFKVDQNETL